MTYVASILKKKQLTNWQTDYIPAKKNPVRPILPLSNAPFPIAMHNAKNMKYLICPIDSMCVVLSGLSTLQRYKIWTPLVKYFGIFFQTFFRRVVGNAKRMDGDGYMRADGRVSACGEGKKASQHSQERWQPFQERESTLTAKSVNEFRTRKRIGLVRWSVGQLKIHASSWRVSRLVNQ